MKTKTTKTTKTTYFLFGDDEPVWPVMLYVVAILLVAFVGVPWSLSQ